MPTAETTAWEQETHTTQQWSECAVQQPPENTELKAEIEQARKLIDSGEKWEGERGQSYSETTFDRASAFLKMHSDYLKSYQLKLPAPHIGTGPNGSIDLHWKRERWELLINIPASPNEMATFYGDNYGVQNIKGSVDPQTFNLGLAAWLMN